jgi:hypothetical protein
MGMRRSLLAAFRTADARSLAKALVLLVAISGVLGAFHAGGMASPSNFSGIICGSQGISLDGPAKPSGEHEHFCCLFGCTTIAAGIVAKTEPPTPVAIGSIQPARQPAPTTILVAPAPPGHIGPRGPPLLA